MLTFRATGDEIASLGLRHFAFGMVCAILAGIGRHWDDSTAPMAARLGLGSAAYVIVFSSVMWLFIVLLGPDRWEWTRFTAFVALTSPPAWLYAIPVESLLPPQQASQVNYGFLAFVALWRLLLLAVYVPRYSGLDAWTSFVGWSLPLTAALAALGAFGVLHAITDFMSGSRGPEPQDLAVIKGIGLFAFLFLPLAMFLYLYQWWRR